VARYPPSASPGPTNRSNYMKYSELSTTERALLIGGFILLSPFLLPVFCVAAPIVALGYAVALLLDMLEE
jgi:hypothetical protein